MFKILSPVASGVMRAYLRIILAKIYGPNFQTSILFEFHREIIPSPAALQPQSPQWFHSPVNYIIAVS